MKKIVVGLLLTLSLIGCAGAPKTLKPDRSPSPIDLKFYSAEIIVGDKHYFGIASHRVAGSEPFKFKVAGIHNGNIRVVSPNCHQTISKSYVDFEEVEFSPNIYANLCLFQIFVEPEFTADEAGALQWRGVQGAMLVKKLPFHALTAAIQLANSENHIVSLHVTEPSDVYLRGCGQMYNGKGTPPSFGLLLKASQESSNRVCMLDGFIKSTSTDLDLSILVSRYSDEFLKIPEPRIQFQDGFMRVYADPSVSLIAFQGRTFFDHKAKFFYDSSGDQLLRLYTSSGRYLFCEIISPKEWRCSK